MPLPDEVCPYPPGTEEKIQWMINRVADGCNPNHPLDPTFEGFEPGCLQPTEKTEVFALPRLRLRGIERDGIHWRARPRWLGKKQRLGSFHTPEAAEAVTRRFWIDTLGIFWLMGGRMGGYIVDSKKPDAPPFSDGPTGKDKADAELRKARKPLKCSKAKPLESGGLFGDGKLRLWRAA